MLHKIKRKLLKIKLATKRVLDPGSYGTANHQQTTAYLICKKLIDKGNSTLMMSPISEKRYIKQDDGNLFVIISYDNIQIINHVYSYNIPMHGRVFQKTLFIFNTKMEQLRSAMEAELQTNVQRSLNIIKDSL